MKYGERLFVFFGGVFFAPCIVLVDGEGGVFDVLEIVVAVEVAFGVGDDGLVGWQEFVLEYGIVAKFLDARRQWERSFI